MVEQVVVHMSFASALTLAAGVGFSIIRCDEPALVASPGEPNVVSKGDERQDGGKIVGFSKSAGPTSLVMTR